MSRWHRENPELYEQGYEPWDAIEAQADDLRKDPAYDPTTDEYRERVNEIEQERHLEAEDREHRRREESR